MEGGLVGSESDKRRRLPWPVWILIGYAIQISIVAYIYHEPLAETRSYRHIVVTRGKLDPMLAPVVGLLYVMSTENVTVHVTIEGDERAMAFEYYSDARQEFPELPELPGRW